MFGDTMNIFETMWKELINGTVAAREYSFRQDVTYDQVLERMALIEGHFKEDIDAYQKKELLKKAGEEIEEDLSKQDGDVKK